MKSFLPFFQFQICVSDICLSKYQYFTLQFLFKSTLKPETQDFDTMQQRFSVRFNKILKLHAPIYMTALPLDEGYLPG